jgi:hypothetical protein
MISTKASPTDRIAAYMVAYASIPICMCPAGPTYRPMKGSYLKASELPAEKKVIRVWIWFCWYNMEGVIRCRRMLTRDSGMTERKHHGRRRLDEQKVEGALSKNVCVTIHEWDRQSHKEIMSCFVVDVGYASSD